VIENKAQYESLIDLFLSLPEEYDEKKHKFHLAMEFIKNECDSWAYDNLSHN